MTTIDDKIGGVIAAVPTPVNSDFSADLGAFVAHCKWALTHGCDALNVLGTTGEASSQDEKTRKKIMRAAAENLDPARLMVGTGAPDLATTVALTRYAAELGYPVALILPPYYYKPVTEDGLFDYFTALDQALKGSPIKLYLYNFPAMTGIQYSVALIKRLAAAMPERICGIKDSSADIPYCKEIVAALPGFKVFPSSETILAEARAAGFAGCISATVNVTGFIAAKLWHGSLGEDPDSLTDSITQLRQGIAAVPLVPAVKYLIGLREKSPEWNRVIPPLQALNSDHKTSLRAVADRLHYL